MSETLTKPQKSNSEIAEQIGRITHKLAQRAVRVQGDRRKDSKTVIHLFSGGDQKVDIVEQKGRFIKSRDHIFINSYPSGKDLVKTSGNSMIKVSQISGEELNGAVSEDLDKFTKDTDKYYTHRKGSPRVYEKHPNPSRWEPLEPQVLKDDEIVHASAGVLAGVRDEIARREIEKKQQIDTVIAPKK